MISACTSMLAPIRESSLGQLDNPGWRLLRPLGKGDQREKNPAPSAFRREEQPVAVVDAIRPYFINVLAKMPRGDETLYNHFAHGRSQGGPVSQP